MSEETMSFEEGDCFQSRDIQRPNSVEVLYVFLGRGFSISLKGYFHLILISDLYMAMILSSARSRQRI